MAQQRLWHTHNLHEEHASNLAGQTCSHARQIVKVYAAAGVILGWSCFASNTCPNSRPAGTCPCLATRANRAADFHRMTDQDADREDREYLSPTLRSLDWTPAQRSETACSAPVRILSTALSSPQDPDLPAASARLPFDRTALRERLRDHTCHHAPCAYKRWVHQISRLIFYAPGLNEVLRSPATLFTGAHRCSQCRSQSSPFHYDTGILVSWTPGHRIIAFLLFQLHAGQGREHRLR